MITVVLELLLLILGILVHNFKIILMIFNRNMFYWLAAFVVIILFIGRSWKRYFNYYLLTYEGFRSSPYWDYKQWSWGYGTAAGFDKSDKPEGEITKEQALKEALAHAEKDRKELAKVIKRKLTGKQWAALLSFSYNLGLGNALKIVDTLNEWDTELLMYRWLSFNKVDGVLNEGILNRRKDEWKKFISG